MCTTRINYLRAIGINYACTTGINCLCAIRINYVCTTGINYLSFMQISYVVPQDAMYFWHQCDNIGNSLPVQVYKLAGGEAQIKEIAQEAMQSISQLLQIHWRQIRFGSSRCCLTPKCANFWQQCKATTG